jgi:hypothetical protein
MHKLQKIVSLLVSLTSAPEHCLAFSFIFLSNNIVARNSSLKIDKCDNRSSNIDPLQFTYIMQYISQLNYTRGMYRGLI